MIKNNQYIIISNGYRGGNITFLSDHIDFLSKQKKNIILIDDNPKKSYEKIPSSVKIKKISTNNFNKKTNNELSKILLTGKDKKCLFITNYAFIVKYFFLIRKFKKKKNLIILTIHSGLLSLNVKNYLAGFLFSLIYGMADVLCFGSSSAKNWWMKFYPWMKIKKASIHYNGVEIKKRSRNNKIGKKISISFIGRLEKENNPELFLLIAKEYLKKKKNIIFNIFGDGQLENHLKKNLLNKNIIFHGWSKKEKIYRKTDIVIITSPVNNFPYVALEAKSFGIPVITCSKGDISKIVKSGVDGYVLKTNTIEKFSESIDKILDNYSFFSNNSLKGSKNFNKSKLCKKFWDSLDI